MKRSSLKIKTIAVALAMGMILSASACGKKKEEETTTSEETTTETTPMVTVPTTEATTTLMEYGSTLAPNDQSVSWTEETMEPKVMYVNITSGYLKVRKGPGTDYEHVGSLTANMQVIVVAKTDTNWYKTQDGFYVSGDYLSLTQGG